MFSNEPVEGGEVADFLGGHMGHEVFKVRVGAEYDGSLGGINKDCG